ncbi:cell division protein FtsL [Actibacterium sp. XHP0104]|uniref:cell division protein FtsL n=1 Tax=Actibacterium sp. XHP0104 TaxID=2984335 RepID=UPI0021E740CC|nr:cell division protein FtsL [Actibacterium sp. XHP0104]MCV2881320.1 cell division protein FtsL [Actibacterium sp. XHP0104]
MRGLFYVLGAIAVMGLAFWAYRENYAARQAIEQTEALNREIGDMRATRAMLRAEWAYLNRPDRLRELAELNFGRLGLLEMQPEQFGRIDQVAFPTQEDVFPALSRPIEVVGRLDLGVAQ